MTTIQGGLRAGDLKDWIRDRLQADLRKCHFVVGPYIPDEPDEVCIVTKTGGSGAEMDGLFDNYTFQIRYRGQQEHFESAEDGAMLVDHVLRSAENVSIAGVPGLAFRRTGGPPDPDAPDDGGRTAFICNYVLTIGSDL